MDRAPEIYLQHQSSGRSLFSEVQKEILVFGWRRDPCDQKYSQFIGADTTFLKEVPSQILRNGAYRWMSGYQRFFKKLSDRPTIKKKHGRQSVMITKELFTFYSVDPQTAMIDLGTRKHPVGSVMVNVHLDYEVPASDLHLGSWRQVVRLLFERQ